MCFDEFGPVEVRPQSGSSWAPRARPRRHRATYTRRHGVRYYFAAYDVHGGELWMEQKRRKRAVEVLEFLAVIRARYPTEQRIHLVMDNLSTHATREVRSYCRRNRIRMVFTATNASWMNRIECHFAPLKHFVIANSDWADHAAIEQAVQDYLCWRNANAQDSRLLKEQNTIRVL